MRCWRAACAPRASGCTSTPSPGTRSARPTARGRMPLTPKSPTPALPPTTTRRAASGLPRPTRPTRGHRCLSPRIGAFYDDAATRAAILNVERTLFASSRLSSSELGKFYSMCTHTALGGNGAIRASAVQAYEWLVAQMPDVSDRDGALTQLGFLTGHYCNTPVLLGLRAMHRLVMGAMAGTPFQPRELATALFTMGEDAALQAAWPRRPTISFSTGPTCRRARPLTILRRFCAAPWAEATRRTQRLT